MAQAELATGVNLYYEVHGSGTPVILIPGTGFSADVWRPHPVEDLQDEYSVITFDFRGMGRSSAPNAVMTVEQMAADVAELIRHLELEAVHIIGHSIGGRIGLAVSLNYPRLVRSLIMAASGSGSAIRPGEDAAPTPQHRLLRRLIERGLEEHVRIEICENDGYFTEDFRQSHPEEVEAFYRRAWEHHADLEIYLRQVAARHSFEATHRLPFLEVPVCVLIGSSDVAGGGAHLPASHELAKRIDGSELKTIPGVSHGFFWQKPQETTAELKDWLGRH